ncbi:hypothetical protein [Paenibacillus sp. B1-33]|uniref:hypothetical protein n=1 Tax=unclassified Paenibacillus TaxID=185978 RepID=UPI003D2C0D62
MKKKFVSISLFCTLTLTLASVVFAGNDSLEVVAQPGEDNKVQSISGQDKNGKFTLSTTKSGGLNYARAAVMNSCDSKYIDVEIKGVGSVTRTFEMSSKCEYRVRLMNETGGVAKAYLRNWE